MAKRKLPKITLEKVIDENPCWIEDAYYEEGGFRGAIKAYEKIKKLFGNRKSVTAIDVLKDRRIEVGDRVWLATRDLPQDFIDQVFPPEKSEFGGPYNRHDIFEYFHRSSRALLKALETYVAGKPVKPFWGAIS